MKRLFAVAAVALCLCVGASTASAATFVFTYNGITYTCTTTATTITCVDNAIPPNTYQCSKVTRSCTVNGEPVTAQDIWSLIRGL